MEKPNSLVIRMARHDLTAKQLFQQAAGLVLVNAVTIQKMVCANVPLIKAFTDIFAVFLADLTVFVKDYIPVIKIASFHMNRICGGQQ